MVTYRRFRNTDPPGLVSVWNESFTGRSAVRLPNSAALEQWVFCKPYFDPAGLIIAEEDSTYLGFAHAGFGAGPGDAAPSTSAGAICLVAVRPSHRRQGIGSALVQQCEAYLRERGAQTLYAGPFPSLNPFYLGLYGGAGSCGFLDSDADAQPFFLRQGYQTCQEIMVLHRRLAKTVQLADPRVPALRQRYQVRIASPKTLGNWWQDCVCNVMEPLEFYLEDVQTKEIGARALIWEMEGYSQRWNQPIVGILDFSVPGTLRRQGVGKFLLALLLRQLQEQFFEVVETQINKSNTAGMRFCERFAFEQVDTGRVFQKVMSAG